MTHTYRKKIVDVQAWQNTKENFDALNSELTTAFPQFLLTGIGLGNVRVMPDNSIHVTTDTGQLVAVPTDYWIIEGVNGELYPCAPDVFATLYDPVE